MTMPQTIKVTVTQEDWDNGLECSAGNKFWAGTCAFSQAILRLDFVKDVVVCNRGRVQIQDHNDNFWRYLADGVGKELATVFDSVLDNKRNYNLKTPRTVVLTMEDWLD